MSFSYQAIPLGQEILWYLPINWCKLMYWFLQTFGFRSSASQRCHFRQCHCWTRGWKHPPSCLLTPRSKETKTVEDCCLIFWRHCCFRLTSCNSSARNLYNRQFSCLSSGSCYVCQVAADYPCCFGKLVQPSIWKRGDLVPYWAQMAKILGSCLSPYWTWCDLWKC